MKKLIFATNNKNKLQEVQHMLVDDYEVLGLAELGFNVDIPETEKSLEGNARLKAQYVRDRMRIDVFADDTGLEVEALDGAPGVHSARYAGEGKSSEDNMKKLLSELEGAANRKARFRTVVALITDQEEHLFEGIANGEITRKKSGAEGFGYDPIFSPEGHNQTFAEMSAEEKNDISHRGIAIAKLVKHLKG